MRLLSGHHGPFFIGAYVLVGQSFGVSVSYGLAIGAVVFDDLVRASVLGMAKKQSHRDNALRFLFHRLRRMDLDRNHTADMTSIAFKRNEEGI